MPIIKSSKKRVRQTISKTKRNIRLKKDIRAAMQDFEAKLASKKPVEIANAQSKLYSLFDTAAKKNVFHKNKAARRKAQIAKKVSLQVAKNSSKKQSK